MEKNDILVSISCITYNHADFIRDALDSFLAQDVKFKYEIIVHDDASTDGTADIVREYQEKYPEIIKAIYQENNQYSQGVPVTKTFVHPIIRGKYTAICEGDDYWLDPHKLQKQVDYLERHPECAYTFHNAQIVWLHGEPYRVFFPNDKLKNKVWKNCDAKLNCGDIVELGFAPTASIVVRTDYYVNRPDFCEKPICGDLPMRLYFGTRGYGYYFNEIMSAYRIGNIQSASGRAGVSIESMRRTLNGHKAILMGFNDYTEGKWETEVHHDIARRTLNFYMESRNPILLKDPQLRRLLFKEATMKGLINYLTKTFMPGFFDFLKAGRNYIKFK